MKLRDFIINLFGRDIPKLKKEEKMRKPKFELTENWDGEYYFNLIAPNGKIIATSEMYNSKQSAIKGINSVKKNAKIAEIKESD